MVQGFTCHRTAGFTCRSRCMSPLETTSQVWPLWVLLILLQAQQIITWLWGSGIRTAAILLLQTCVECTSNTWAGNQRDSSYFLSSTCTEPRQDGETQERGILSPCREHWKAHAWETTSLIQSHTGLGRAAWVHGKSLKYQVLLGWGNGIETRMLIFLCLKTHRTWGLGGHVEEGKGRINGDERSLDLG